MRVTNEQNELFPIFLKLNELEMLIVGGGKVALEKLNAVLGNSPNTKITIVSKEISPEILKIATKYSTITLIKDAFKLKYLKGKQLLITAINDVILSQKISLIAKKKGVLCNAADKPEFCDFYLGAIVQKGNLKIGISTNGKSPTMAKRIKEMLQESIPIEINSNFDSLNKIRQQLKGDFEAKVEKLNQLTEVFSKCKE